MDRRAFLTRVGTIGAAAGWTTPDAAAGSIRARGLATSAGFDTFFATGRAVGDSGLPHGLALGYLLGSPGLLARAAEGGSVDAYAEKLKWIRWDAAKAQALFPPERIRVSFGILRAAQAAGTVSLLRGIEVIAHFAIDGTPHFVPFPAWKYEAAGHSKRGSASPPLAFEAAAPNRVALQVDYALDPARISSGLAPAGKLYLPLSGRDGPGVGLYVLAAPSSRTGRAPDLGACVFSGDLRSPLARPAGGEVDFDYVAMTVRPVAA